MKDTEYQCLNWTLGCKRNCTECIAIRSRTIRRRPEYHQLIQNGRWTGIVLEVNNDQLQANVKRTNKICKPLMINYSGDVSYISQSSIPMKLSLLQQYCTNDLLFLTKEPKLFSYKIDNYLDNFIHKYLYKVTIAISVTRQEETYKIQQLIDLFPYAIKSIWFLPLLQEIDLDNISLEGITSINVGGLLGSNPTSDSIFDRWYDSIAYRCKKEDIICRYQHASSTQDRSAKQERQSMQIIQKKQIQSYGKPSWDTHFYGNSEVVQQIKTYGRAFRNMPTNKRQNNMSWDLILTGPSGHGKTTIARGFSEELGLPLLELDGSSFQYQDATNMTDDIINGLKVANLLDIDGNPHECMIFIDEADRMLLHCKLAFCKGLEEERSLPSKQGKNLSTRRIIFVFATTALHKFDKQILNRLTELSLALYSEDEAIELMLYYAKAQLSSKVFTNLEKDRSTCIKLIHLCLCNPRDIRKEINRLCKEEYANDLEDIDVCKLMMQHHQCNARGLRVDQERVICLLGQSYETDRTNKNMSRTILAQIMQISKLSFTQSIEDPLIQLGLITSNKGRCTLTNEGTHYYHIAQNR